jgi:16S rRNA pseudouridine516 synthase
MRLDKYLSDLNAGTRKEIKEAVRKGRVRVNGETASDPGMRLSGTEEVLFDGRRMIREEHVYYMMNKPAGVVCAVTDAKCRTVLDLMGDARRKDLFPVGRLDKDTVGLLLLTNDGQFDHRLMSPRRHVEKTYFVRVDGAVSGDDVRAFS